ncbi:MAG: AraC family transcriptional regulator [Polyangiaceae bacterium]
MDTLSTILRSIRLQTAIVSRGHYTDPWGVFTRGAAKPIFHAIVRGECLARLDRKESGVVLRAGDVVVLPQGVQHTLASGPGVEPIHVSEVAAKKNSMGVPLLRHGGRGSETYIVCGTFHLDHEAANSLFDLMPPLIHLRPDQPELVRWMGSTLDLLDNEISNGGPGSETVVARLTDLLVVQLLRQYARNPAVPVAGWLAAVHDDQIGRALALIHSDPGGDWSATKLAAAVGLSRTRFFERFTGLVGEPPSRYLARWRATAAADLIRRRELSTAELAGLVGYASEYAFGRVFRRYLGVSPAEYRRRVRAPQ